jgi:glycosyltransferase involved in cell wall biosynthesis
MSVAHGNTLAGLSVVLPAFNEDASLAATVRDALAVLRGMAIPFEILVVDDGSTDGTAAVAAQLARDAPAVQVVRHPVNRGYGAALRSGFAVAAFPWIFFTDADGQFDVAELARLVPLAATHDVVAGFRRQRRDPWHRRVYAFVFGRLVVRPLLGVRVWDVNCAFKLLRRELLGRLDLRSEGALINAELLAKAARAGARIVEVGVTHRERRAGTPTGGRPAVIVRALREILALRREISAFRPRA